MGILNRLKAWWNEEDEAAPSPAPHAGAASLTNRVEGGILIGRDPTTSKLLWYQGKGNVTCIAPSRQGKLVSSIGGNVMFHPNSLLVLDPKGEITHHFHRLRSEGYGQPVYFLNPDLLHGLPCHGFNPIQWLEYDSDRLASDAGIIAQSLIAAESDKNKHWSDEAIDLVRGLLLYVAFDSRIPDTHRNLITVRKFIRDGKETIKDLLLHADLPEVKSLGQMLASKSDNEFSSVFSTVKSNTNFLDDHGMARVLARPNHENFDLRDIKRKRISVFIIVPLDLLDGWQGWYRMMVRMAVKIMMNPHVKHFYKDAQALSIIDEAFAVGPLKEVELSNGLMPGEGLRLFQVIHSMQQLSNMYPHTYRDVIKNSGVVQAFTITDAEEAAHFQASMRQRPRLGGQIGQFEPMERTDQIMYNRPGQLLTIIQGGAPRWIERANWVEASIVLDNQRIQLPIAPEIANHPLYHLVDTSKL